jgi:hypothetical protein
MLVPARVGLWLRELVAGEGVVIGVVAVRAAAGEEPVLLTLFREIWEER